MSEPEHQNGQTFFEHVRGYLIVFVALILGTALTVWASYIPFSSRAINIGVALAIASTKAFLVAGYFMHLITERKLIYAVMAFTGFFFVGLIGLTMLAYSDFPVHTFWH
jgi:cytochrome c oxidase subunit 4